MLDWKIPKLEFIILEKFKLHAHQYLDTHAPSFVNNAKVIKHIDAMSQNFVIYFETMAMKGETITQTRQERFQHSTFIPKNLWNFIKYTLNKTKWYGNNFRHLYVEYIEDIAYFTKDFPVACTLICPHYDSKLEDNRDHFKFLLPHNLTLNPPNERETK